MEQGNPETIQHMTQHMDAAGALERLRQGEEANFAASTAEVGEVLSVIEALVSLYDWIASELGKPGVPERCVDVVPGLPFLRFAQYLLVAAELNSLRCQLSDAAVQTRMAVEAVAVLDKMQREPDLVYLWLRAGVDPAEAKKYRKRTSGPKLFPPDNEEMRPLAGFYDVAARLSHPGFASIVRRLHIPPGSRTALDFHWFEVPLGSKAEPARTLFWVAEAHCCILDVFVRIFRAVIDGEAWKIRRDSADALLNVQAQKWMPTIGPHEDWYKKADPDESATSRA